MPRYDYRCEECGNEFEIEESMAQHEQARHECPECGSSSLRRVLRGAHVQTPSKT